MRKRDSGARGDRRRSMAGGRDFRDRFDLGRVSGGSAIRASHCSMIRGHRSTNRPSTHRNECGNCIRKSPKHSEPHTARRSKATIGNGITMKSGESSMCSGARVVTANASSVCGDDLRIWRRANIFGCRSTTHMSRTVARFGNPANRPPILQCCGR